MQSRNSETNNSPSEAHANAKSSAVANTDLYDLWLNSTLSTGTPSRVAGVTSSSCHQISRRARKDIDSTRLAETLIQLSRGELGGSAAQGRL